MVGAYRATQPRRVQGADTSGGMHGAGGSPQSNLGVLAILFSYKGRINRLTFLTAMLGVVLVFSGGIYGAAKSLPLIAEFSAPHGLNAGFILNAIWIVLGCLATWSLTAISVKRLVDRGRSAWWAIAAFVPPAIIVGYSDLLFLSAPALNDGARGLILLVCAVLATWIVLEGSLVSGRR